MSMLNSRQRLGRYISPHNIPEQLYSNNTGAHEQYQILIEFELKREKQKTKILEQRLHNKEIFIKQMKQFQDQLTIAFEKCQEQLSTCKKQLEINTYAETREYLEEIAQLKHLVIRLQEEINFYQRKINHDRKRFSSLKRQQEQQSPEIRKKRSKTLMNQQEKQIYKQTKILTSLEEQIIKDSKKISSFINQFLLMVQCFNEQSKHGNLKQKLKVAWKWIKIIVSQWNNIKIKNDGFLKQICQITKQEKIENAKKCTLKILRQNY